MKLCTTELCWLKNKMTNDTLNELLCGEEAPETDDRTRNSFNPAFNVREEFAIWARQEFPELQRCVERRQKYPALLEREAEVIEGARKAYQHAMKTLRTGSCIHYSFKAEYKEFEDRTKGLAYRLESFVSLIERTSDNL